MSRHKIQKSSFSTHTSAKKSSPLTQTRPWTNPYLQRNTEAEQQPTNTVKPPTTEEWLKDNIMLRAIETRQAQLQQQAIQAKLTVGEPGDKYEQEADAMASQVMSMSEPAVQKESEEKLQTKPLAQRVTPVIRLTAARNGSIQAQSNLENRLNSSKGGGSPLPNQVRGFMQPRFGADFSQVRVHTDSTAVQMSRDLGAPVCHWEILAL
ncbi:OmpA/MotB domain-containing protein [Cylindrospermum sp. NIES-4074]|nr:OmpA/MotB domain-containing protein [Cylindrospermum sp. NIES-4074]